MGAGYPLGRGTPSSANREAPAGSRAAGELEERLDDYFQKSVALDADLIPHTNAPADINTALRNSAQFSFHAAVRDSVRGLLTDAAGAVAAVRTRLDSSVRSCGRPWHWL